MSKSAVRSVCNPQVAALSSFFEALGAAPVTALPTAREALRRQRCSVALNVLIEQCVGEVWLKHRSYIRQAVKEILSLPPDGYTYSYLFTILEKLYARIRQPLAVMSHRLLHGMNEYFGTVTPQERNQKDGIISLPSVMVSDFEKQRSRIGVAAAFA